MVRTVYLDVLFGVNLSVNYLLLLSSGKLAQRTIRPKRLIFSSLSGAVYACSQFYFPQNILYCLPMKILVGSFMVWNAYPKLTPAGFCIMVGSFYISSAVAAGTAYAFLCSAMPIWGAMTISLAFLPVIPLVASLGGFRPGRKRPLVDIEIALLGKLLPGKAFVDTGNNLSDPISGLPVIVTDFCFVQRILPKESYEFFLSAGAKLPQGLESSPLGVRIGLVPLRTVMGGKDVLPAFRPDAVLVKNKDGSKVTKKALVAVCGESISPDGGYQVLMHPDLLNT